MAFGNTRRSSGAGFASRAPQRPGGSAVGGGGNSSRPSAGNPHERPRNQWTTITTMYDPYHSSLEPTVVSEMYKTSFCIKLAPVFSQRVGPDDGGTGKKYDHDNAVMVVFELSESIGILRQLHALLNGELYEFTVARLETKRVIFTRAEVYYDESHPDTAVHQGGIVIAIEEDPSDKNDGRSVVFISRPQFLKVRDWAEQTQAEIDAGTPPQPAEDEVFYPELTALVASLESYVNNIARVDFSSQRLLANTERAERSTDTAAPMPTRRGGGLAAPTGTRTGVTPPRPTASAPAQSTSTGMMNEADIDGLLGGGTGDDDLDAALGETNKF